MVLEFEGYKTVDLIMFIWRDGLEVAESLFGDPTFSTHMRFDPIRIDGPLGVSMGSGFQQSKPMKFR